MSNKLNARVYGLLAYTMYFCALSLIPFIFIMLMNEAKLEGNSLSTADTILIVISISLAVIFLAKLKVYFNIRSILRSRKRPDTTQLKIYGIFNSILSQQMGKSPAKRLPILNRENFSTYDTRYDFFYRNVEGGVKIKEVFFTVADYSLPRSMPHVFFDSKNGLGRNYNKIFIGAQRVTLEGNFSNTFDVYMPIDYQIDTLSFITPEIMEAMLKLPDYDFELVDGSILCIAPLLSDSDLPEFEQKTQALFASLSRNVNTYMDNRLDYDESKRNVTAFGSRLLMNPTRYIRRILATLAIAGLLAWFFMSEGGRPDSTIIFYFTSITTTVILIQAFLAIRLYSRNRQALTVFRETSRQ